MKKIPRVEFEADNLRVQADILFDARTEEIAPIVEKVMSIIREMNCAQGKEFEVEIALREALVNAVVHGCKKDPSKKVRCFVACDEKHGILLIVRDSGQGFDPNSLPHPLRGENLFASHGRGIYLINQLMDEVTFKNGGTEIHMRKK